MQHLHLESCSLGRITSFSPSPSHAQVHVALLVLVKPVHNPPQPALTPPSTALLPHFTSCLPWAGRAACGYSHFSPVTTSVALSGVQSPPAQSFSLWLLLSWLLQNKRFVMTWTLELSGQTFDGYFNSCRVVTNLSRSYTSLEGDLDYHATYIFTSFL